MAVDIFLKLENIKGESKDETHKDEIDIYSFSWGLSQTGSFGTGGGGGTGKVNVSDMSFMKKADKSSPDLMKCVCNGKHIASGVLTCRKAGENPLEYMVVELTDIIVTSVQHSGAGGGGDDLTESLTLNFSSFKVKYTEQLKEGGAGEQPEMGWDVKANVAA